MAFKPNFTKKKKRRVHGTTFWDAEYTNPTHLKLSTAESEDLAKFMRWLGRQDRADLFVPGSPIVDIGCGNGRNLIYLAREFGFSGFGYDISAAAIAQARTASQGFPLMYTTGTGATPLASLEAESQAIALDMMVSHFFDRATRTQVRDEIFRVLKPGGFLFMKTFLRDDDLHTARLVKEFPGPEPFSYIHPVMGVAEYVYDEATLVDFLSEKFIVRKIYRSHKHRSHGKANKRRTISIYAEKDFRT